MANILCFETSSLSRSVAISTQDTIYQRIEEEPIKHENRLLIDASNILAEVNVQLNDLDAIAFGQGPGSFTGIRIACCLAQGLAYGLSCPVIAQSSLKILALDAALLTGASNILVAMDARMKQVYWGEYHIKSSSEITTLHEDSLSFPNEVYQSRKTDSVVVGSAWLQYQHQFEFDSRVVINSDITTPQAATLARLAMIAHQNNEGISPLTAKPAYVRQQVATPSKK